MKPAMPHSRALPAGFIAPCLPTNAPTPSGGEWLHEIKFDGFRVIARKNDRVKLYSRTGNELGEERGTSSSCGQNAAGVRYGTTLGRTACPLAQGNRLAHSRKVYNGSLVHLITMEGIALFH
jgi:hypothetical protein